MLRRGPLLVLHGEGEGANVRHGSFVTLLTVDRFRELLRVVAPFHYSSSFCIYFLLLALEGSTEWLRGYGAGENGIGLPVHVVLQLDLYWTVPRGLVLVVVLILRYLCEKRERNDRGNLLHAANRRNFSWETLPYFPRTRTFIHSDRVISWPFPYTK